MDIDALAESIQHLRRCAASGDGQADAPATQARERFDELWASLRLDPTRGIVARYRNGLDSAGRSCEDAEQALGVRLYERLDQWHRERGPLVPWWSQVVHNYLRSAIRPPGGLAIDALPDEYEPADTGPGTEAVTLDAVEREQLGDVWEKYVVCVKAVLAESAEPQKVRRRFLAFELVDLAEVPNQTAAQRLRIAAWQCTRDRQWARRELARAFRRLFPELGE